MVGDGFQVGLRLARLCLCCLLPRLNSTQRVQALGQQPMLSSLGGLRLGSDLVGVEVGNPLRFLITAVSSRQRPRSTRKERATQGLVKE